MDTQATEKTREISKISQSSHGTLSDTQLRLAHQNRPGWNMLRIVLFELGPLPSDLVLNGGDDDLEVIHFFTEYIDPWACDDNRVNQRLETAKLWHRHQLAERHAISKVTFLSRDNDIPPLPFDLVREVYHNGHKVLKICQHPLLYLCNHFVVDFEVALSAPNRSQLKQVMRFVSPRARALLFTPAPKTISPHLQIRIQMSKTRMTFASLL
ncbi:hypothetical protein KCU77_g4657, partial [Aureobasidium melanogenum]